MQALLATRYRNGLEKNIPGLVPFDGSHESMVTEFGKGWALLLGLGQSRHRICGLYAQRPRETPGLNVTQFGMTPSIS